ncbi:MAG TPA: thiamine pyrophosphate-binding protein, partial [Candidatus Limnocylindrales bacterium]|nr:thiamine pyrophosphate-binding protein [Candidatus Limnocylindrales bacterium]
MAHRATVGRLIARSLAAAGVEWAFTVPGESFLGVLDELPGVGIRVVATRHEGGAAFMAEAVGQLTGTAAAVLGTRAVGAGNMAIGIHTARQNSTPMVAIVGQVQREFLGREAFQEVDQVESFGRLAKWAAEVDDPQTAADVVAAGLREMVDGRPGPILLSLPEDVLDLPAPRRRAPSSHASQPSSAARLDRNAVREILQRLQAAKRPAILAGQGVIAADAVDQLVSLSERLSAPVFASWRRPTVFPNHHSNFLGMTGYGAADTVRPGLERSDFLLVIGCRLNEITSFEYAVPGKRTRWAHVDLEPRTKHAGLGAPDIALAADAKMFLDVALDELARAWEPPRDRSVALHRDRAAFLAASEVEQPDSFRGPGIHPGRVITTLEQVLPDDALLTIDAGNFGGWVARGFRFGRRNGFLGPTSGAMGYGLPAAIAASLCQPRR